MSEKVRRFIGEKLGKVIEVKVDENGFGLGSCLLIRAEIDTRKALERRIRVGEKGVEDEKSFLVDLKYERIPSFCFGCGLIGHNVAECAITLRLRKVKGDFTLQYGSWLRAPGRQFFSKGRLGGGFAEASKTKQKDDQHTMIPVTQGKEYQRKEAGNGGDGGGGSEGDGGTGLVEIQGDISVILGSSGREFELPVEGKLPLVPRNPVQLGEGVSRARETEEMEVDKSGEDKILVVDSGMRGKDGGRADKGVEQDNKEMGLTVNGPMNSITKTQAIGDSPRSFDVVGQESLEERSGESPSLVEESSGQKIKWKRKARVGLIGNENVVQGAEGGQNKRKTNEEELRESNVEGRNNKHRALEDLSEQASEAGNQPRRSQ